MHHISVVPFSVLCILCVPPFIPLLPLLLPLSLFMHAEPLWFVAQPHFILLQLVGVVLAPLPYYITTYEVSADILSELVEENSILEYQCQGGTLQT